MTPGERDVVNTKFKKQDNYWWSKVIVVNVVKGVVVDFGDYLGAIHVAVVVTEHDLPPVHFRAQQIVRVLVLPACFMWNLLALLILSGDILICVFHCWRLHLDV